MSKIIEDNKLVRSEKKRCVEIHTTFGEKKNVIYFNYGHKERDFASRDTIID